MSYEKDLTLDDDKQYSERPRGVEFTTLSEYERDSNMLLFTGISYLGAGLASATVGLVKGVYSVKPKATLKVKINTILSVAGPITSKGANTTASTVFTFGMIKRLIYSAFDIHEEGTICSTISGFAVGMLYNAPKGIVRSSLGGVLGATIGFLSALGTRDVVDK
ncbi:hypothetical protein RB653_000263 [Dictyostelium firmibasis]|uniref:Uncharacterized protein n=1 Tax=Dictyostelium firmibasis TaxID=79012 RepID=A0AAN7UF45_9MYCE